MRIRGSGGALDRSSYCSTTPKQALGPHGAKATSLQGKTRHKLPNCLLSLLTGLLAGCVPLRDVDKFMTYYRVGVLRAVQITAVGQPALGPWAMPPVPGKLKENKEKQKHTGETTHSLPFIGWLCEQYVNLTRHFTFDAGL